MKSEKFKKNDIVVFHDAQSRELTVPEGLTRTYIVDVLLSNGEHVLNLTIEPKKDSRAYVVVLAKLKGNATLALHTNQFHDAPSGFSDFLCKVVLFDSTRFSYSGTINITKNGQHAHAYQRNENLLMSESAYVSSEPKLEISANEVFCTHGATIGYISPEIQYYMASRGLSKKKSVQLVSTGFLSSGLDKIKETFIERDLGKMSVLKVLDY
ncbi:MAG: SufD family Fe-S cluster assembly protein [Candidatus Roizmanbacteria bacterium]|nr:SufD family Fe-S cluster assembly protein [Candidatus Roizmanbacteria bacterium]